MNEHKKRCATCKNTVVTEVYPDSYKSFYARNGGIVLCSIDNQPILMEIYHKIERVGCASHEFSNEFRLGIPRKMHNKVTR
jgi:hypothetical protein